VETKTEKLHHHQPFLSTCDGVIIEIDLERGGLILNRTVAYAENGGQQGDTGIIAVEIDGKPVEFPFTDTQKGIGRPIYLQDFPVIQVDTPVYHAMSLDHLMQLKVGQEVVVRIDTIRRGLLTVSHTGIHLALMGLEHLRPDYYKRIKGCGIRPDQSRLDFMTEDKFTTDDIERVSDYVNNLVARDLRMDVYAHKDEPEAWYWELLDKRYPCGGTHLVSTGLIGGAIIKRESLGKMTQRLIFKFENHKPPLYHDKA
jgi:alanyl-tRNA synthetase